MPDGIPKHHKLLVLQPLLSLHLQPSITHLLEAKRARPGAGRFSISIYLPAGGRNRRAHTAESDPRKKVCFRFAKIFAFGDGVFLEVIF